MVLHQIRATDDWLTSAELREEFKISESEERRWRNEDGLPAYRFGHKSYRYLRSEILEWARRHRAK